MSRKPDFTAGLESVRRLYNLKPKVETMLVVINNCYGGFGGISADCAAYLREYDFPFEIRDDWGDGEYAARIESMDDRIRTDPILIDAVLQLGPRASGQYAEMIVISIPEDVSWYVAEYDGKEWIAEEHRSWGATSAMTAK